MRVETREISRCWFEAHSRPCRSQALQFISGLKFTLTQGLPQEKLCALRQCVERILIDKPGRSVVVKIKAVPASTIKEVEELTRELGPADAVAVQ